MEESALVVPVLPPRLMFAGGMLRELRPSDASALLTYLSDPQVVEHTSIPTPTAESVRRSIASAQCGYAERTSCKLAIALSPDDSLVGTCGFTNWSLDHGWAELAYDLAVPYWGQGLASRAVKATLDWAFYDLGLRRIHAMVMTSNSRSIRLLVGSGFVFEGTFRSFRLCRGTPRDFHVYSILSEERASREPG